MNTVIDEIDYGPLAQLIGKWSGDKGMDNAPDTNANSDKTAFADEITFITSGAAKNANEQHLVSIKYHHIVRKISNGQVFHDQIGHWIYEESTNIIMHSLSIPRGVCVLAGGEYVENNGEGIFSVEANIDNQAYGILQSPFMIEKAQTTAFKMHLSIKDNELKYKEIMSLNIYGKEFEHTDESILFRV